MMPVTRIDIREVSARWSEIVSLVAEGSEVIVTEGDIPRAKLVPLTDRPTRVPGLHSGAIEVSDDFDVPLPEDFWTGAS